MVEAIDDDQMNERIARMGRILDYRASRERLYQRRAAICRQLLYATEAKLSRLHHEQAALRNGADPPAATAHWYQQRQRMLANLDRRITRVQHTHQQLKQRVFRRQAELVGAAQLRRAAQKAITRLQQQATQAAQRSRQRRFDNLVRTEQVSGSTLLTTLSLSKSHNPNFNVTIT